MRYGIWIVLLILTACGGKPSDDIGNGKEGAKVYRHSMNGAPNGLDPVQSGNVYANFIVVNAYDTLYGYQYLANPYLLKPNLAKDLPTVSDDGLTYTIKIKQGVEFVDDECFTDDKGREVTADDFVYSLLRHFDPRSLSQGAWLWQGRIDGVDAWKDNGGSDYDKVVSGLKALDRHTIQITLVKPYPQLTHTLATGFSAIVAQECVEHYGKEFSIHPVGSGPY
ncbi:MAG: ABC transporter substrate-binding protein, partial [Gammaproteobacteria bacterium]|nr:ABC transporter substrate-binding protein [Gammaproteobacteria bacterium]